MNTPNKIIIPTIGRQVWFFGLPEIGIGASKKFSEQPMAATIVHVWGDRCVNLDVIDHAGKHFFVSSCTLLKEGDTPQSSIWCEWMPYQKGQAAKEDPKPEPDLEYKFYPRLLGNVVIREGVAYFSDAADVVRHLASDGTEENRLLDFGTAIELLKQGVRVARTGWNGKGMWLQLRHPSVKTDLPYIFMRTVQGQNVPWLASQTDMLAEDWVLAGSAS